MVAVKIDLVGDLAVEINGSYEIAIVLVGAPDLTLYQGKSQIRKSVTDVNPWITPSITVLSKDSFKFAIGFGMYPRTFNSGMYIYDVLFYKPDNRFYAVEGNVEAIKRATVV